MAFEITAYRGRKGIYSGDLEDSEGNFQALDAGESLGLKVTNAPLAFALDLAGTPTPDGSQTRVDSAGTVAGGQVTAPAQFTLIIGPADSVTLPDGPNDAELYVRDAGGAARTIDRGVIHSVG